MTRELLDPKARQMLDEMEAADRPNASQIPIAQARANLERLFADLGPGPEVSWVRDQTFTGPGGPLAVRVYGGVGARSDRPLVVYFHGGGHSQGSLGTTDALCRGLANACNGTIVNVDYRLAPEARFPAAYEDAVAATRWAALNAHELGAQPDRLVVAGDSAGGNLAAAVCATLREPPLPTAQLLIYPLVSFKRQTELYDEAFDGFFLTLDELEYFKELYVPDEALLDDPRLSPLDADRVADMPPAVIVTAQCDPLHRQGEAMHTRLLAAGVNSRLLTYDGMIHGFFGMTTLFAQAQKAFDDVARELGSLLTTCPVASLS